MTQELLGRVHRELIDVLNSINQDKIHHDGDDFHELLNDVEKALAQPEQEPVALLLTDKNINSLQVDSIQRLIDRLKYAHHTDIRVRINGHDEWFEADWLKHMVRVTPSQPEQNPMSDEMLQAITDPENQPSQYGTVTLDYHFEKIKKWEDLFERLSNKVLQQLEQEPVAYATKEDFHRELERRLKHIREEMKIKSVTMRCKNYDIALPIIDTDFGRVLVGQVSTSPQRKPLTDEEIINKCLESGFERNCLGWSFTYGKLDYHLLKLARAIEAAHGIKENT